MFESATSAPSTPRFKPSFPFKLPPLRGGFVRFLLRVSVFVVPLILMRACLVTYVPLDQIGLRQVSFGMNKGLQKQLVEPGYRRAISGYETIRTFPRNIQAVEFTNDETERGADHRTGAAINVPTVDGYSAAGACSSPLFPSPPVSFRVQVGVRARPRGHAG